MDEKINQIYIITMTDYYKKYIMYKRKYLYNIVKHYGGEKMASYGFFMDMFNNDKIIDNYYLCGVEFFTQIISNKNNKITIIGYRNKYKHGYNGCINIEEYIGLMKQKNKNLSIFLDEQINIKTLKIKDKIKKIPQSEMYSYMLNDNQDKIIITTKTKSNELFDNIKHMNILINKETDKESMNIKGTLI